MTGSASSGSSSPSSLQAAASSPPAAASSAAGAAGPASPADEAATCEDLLCFIRESPTPFHAVQSALDRLHAAGFSALQLQAAWPQLGPGGYYVCVGDSTLLAFWIPPKQASDELRGFRIIGAHTDSPNLRLKPRAAYEKHGYLQLGVEVYGGALLNSWLDRDLYIAGRVVVRHADGTLRRRLVQLSEPLIRVAQLAIHLDREINDKGLLLNRQEHLAPIVGLMGGAASRGTDRAPAESAAPPAETRFLGLLARALDTSPESIVSTDLMLADSLAPRRGGLDDELIYAPRLDNLGMCHAALAGLLRTASQPGGHGIDAGLIPVIALFDHEEVGSSSAYGAQAPILPMLLERIAAATGQDVDRRDRYLRALAGSLCVSADMAHAIHPNYADRHEPQHRPRLNGGPVIKHNAQQRYATCGRTAALFADLCARADVPVQHYVHRTDLPCGSTIGPITATLLAIPTVDVGSAMLSMHSARECAGARDPERMARVMTQFLQHAGGLPS